MQKLSNVLCFVSFVGCLLLSGCAMEMNGFSMMDGSPTQNTLDLSDQNRQKHLSEIEKDLRIVRIEQIDEETMKLAKAVLLSLKKLDSATSVGVSYRDYPSYVRNARFEIDEFTSHVRSSKIIAGGLIGSFEQCLLPYVHAQLYFKELVQSQRGSMGESEFKFHLKDNWKTGHQSIALVEKFLFSTEL